MKDTDLIEHIQKLKHPEPREEALLRIKKRVLAEMQQTSRNSTVYTSFFWSSVFAAGMTLTLVLVFANQLPMHSAYHDSINSIALAQQLGDSLEKSKDPAATAQDVLSATKRARETLDTLKLKGSFGMYSQADCLHAYIIYDSYLDYLGDTLERKIPTLSDSATRAVFEDLQAFVKDSRDEAQRRINMYPPQTK